MSFLTEISLILPDYTHKIVDTFEGGEKVCNWKLKFSNTEVEVYKDLNNGFFALFEIANGVFYPSSNSFIFGQDYVIEFNNGNLNIFKKI